MASGAGTQGWWGSNSSTLSYPPEFGPPSAPGAPPPSHNVTRRVFTFAKGATNGTPEDFTNAEFFWCTTPSQQPPVPRVQGLKALIAQVEELENQRFPNTKVKGAPHARRA